MCDSYGKSQIELEKCSQKKTVLDWKIRTQETHKRDARAEWGIVASSISCWNPEHTGASRRAPSPVFPGRTGLVMMQGASPPCSGMVAETASPRAIPEEKWEAATGYNAFSVSLFRDEVNPKISQEPQGVIPKNCQRTLNLVAPCKS